MGTANHEAKVVRINSLEKHPNADNLSIVRIDGYQVVVRTADWHVGDLGVYIQPDSVVPQEPPYAFLWADGDYPDGVVPVKKRRITVKRLRKEYSEGLLMPLSVYHDRFVCEHHVDGTTSYRLPMSNPMANWTSSVPINVGHDLADILGITHYEPPQPIESSDDGLAEKPAFRWPRTWKGWGILLLRTVTFGQWGKPFDEKQPIFRPVYDVENIKNYPDAIPEGTLVAITEKIHGANGRFTFENGKMYIGSREAVEKSRSVQLVE